MKMQTNSIASLSPGNPTAYALGPASACALGEEVELDRYAKVDYYCPNLS